MGNGGMLFEQFYKSYGFKDVPSNVAALIEDGKAFVRLDSSKPLSQVLDSSVDVLFTLMGESASQAFEHSKGKGASEGFSMSLLKNSTTSVRSKAPVTDKGKITQLPILIDNNEIDLDVSLLKKTRTQKMMTWSNLEGFAEASKAHVPFPAVFAGKDSSITLGILGALTESLAGADKYLAAVEKLKAFYAENPEPENIQVYEIIRELSDTPEAPFYAASYTLKNMLKNGLLHPECFHMTHKDVQAFMENNMAAVVFTSLTNHRAITGEYIQRYSAIPRVLGNNGDHAGFYPTNRPTDKRFLNTHFICAVPLKNNRTMEKIVSGLMDEKSQETLCSKTGLAPVTAQCRVPDIQSDDVRFWVAATEAPLTPLDTAVFTNPQNLAQFAQEFAGYIKYLTF